MAQQSMVGQEKVWCSDRCWTSSRCQSVSSQASLKTMDLVFKPRSRAIQNCALLYLVCDIARPNKNIVWSFLQMIIYCFYILHSSEKYLPTKCRFPGPSVCIVMPNGNQRSRACLSCGYGLRHQILNRTNLTWASTQPTHPWTWTECGWVW